MDVREYRYIWNNSELKDSAESRIIEYAVPFGQELLYFGFDSTAKYGVTAYADCVDIIDYINTVDFVGTQTSLNQFGSLIFSCSYDSFFVYRYVAR